jgi:hypothetical protein
MTDIDAIKRCADRRTNSHYLEALPMLTRLSSPTPAPRPRCGCRSSWC